MHLSQSNSMHKDTIAIRYITMNTIVKI